MSPETLSVIPVQCTSMNSRAEKLVCENVHPNSSDCLAPCGFLAHVQNPQSPHEPKMLDWQGKFMNMGLLRTLIRSLITVEPILGARNCVMRLHWVLRVLRIFPKKEHSPKRHKRSPYQRMHSGEYSESVSLRKFPYNT